MGRSEVAWQRRQDIAHVRKIESHTYKSTVVSDEPGRERGDIVYGRHRDKTDFSFKKLGSQVGDQTVILAVISKVFENYFHFLMPHFTTQILGLV
jgi:hypothetical protein